MTSRTVSEGDIVQWDKYNDSMEFMAVLNGHVCMKREAASRIPDGTVVFLSGEECIFFAKEPSKPPDNLVTPDMLVPGERLLIERVPA